MPVSAGDHTLWGRGAEAPSPSAPGERTRGEERTTPVAAVLAEMTARLDAAGIADARIEARLLLQHALQCSREHLYRHLGAPLDAAQIEVLEHLVRARLAGAPLAYLVGEREFYGRTFHVNDRVLIPRPETELLVELAVDFARRYPSPAPLIVDVGTGSGIIAVTLALEVPSAGVVAIDRSPEALQVARDNAARHEVADRIQFVQSDLLAGLAGPFDLIVANLPYVPTDEIDSASPEVRCEPRLALDGGPNGLDLYVRFFPQAARVRATNGGLFAEIAWNQGTAAAGLARATFPDRSVTVRKDLEGRDRVVAVIPDGSDPTARTGS